VKLRHVPNAVMGTVRTTRHWRSRWEGVRMG